MVPAAKESATRKRLPAEQRRALILDAGATLFATRGYEGTTLDDVAAAAGVTKPILYRHFNSKQSLYLALLAKHAEDMPGFVSEAPTTAGGEVDLHAVLDAWFAYAHANGHGWQMIFRDAGGDEEIAAFRREVRERARGVVAGFVAASGAEIEPAELTAVAELIRAGLAGLVLWWAEHPEVPREVVVAAAVRLLRPLLASA